MDEPDDTSWVVEREHIVYDLSEWDQEQVDAAFRMLGGAGIPFHWELFELAVPVAHEPATDEILDRIEYPDQLDEEGGTGAEAGADGGEDAAQLMHELFLHADGVNRSPSGAIARADFVTIAERVHQTSPPYGFNAEWWEQVQLTAALLRRDILDDESPQWLSQRAAELRDALRPYV
jgi:hypothetical protein